MTLCVIIKERHGQISKVVQDTASLLAQHALKRYEYNWVVVNRIEDVGWKMIDFRFSSTPSHATRIRMGNRMRMTRTARTYLHLCQHDDTHLNEARDTMVP